MRTHPRVAALSCILGLSACQVFGQPAAARPQAAASLPAAADARCQREVREYVETLKFIRQSAGDLTGDRVAARYIGEPELQRVVAAQGACAAAQLIRDKSASR